MDHSLTPEETAIVQRVFHGVVSREWYRRTEQNDLELASHILFRAKPGMIVEDTLLTVVEADARRRFSKAGFPVNGDANH